MPGPGEPLKTTNEVPRGKRIIATIAASHACRACWPVQVDLQGGRSETQARWVRPSVPHTPSCCNDKHLFPGRNDPLQVL